MTQEKKESVKLRVNVTGYKGDSVSVFAAYDPHTEILLVAKAVNPAELDDREGFVKVSNTERDDNRDDLFTEDSLSDAIRAYFELDGLKLLILGKDAQRFDPKAKIEPDGVGEGGMKYRLSPDIGNGQVAVMIAARWANMQRTVAAADDFMDQLLTI